MRGLRVESNVLKFFPADSKISRDYRFVAERLTGLYTIELDAVTEVAERQRPAQADRAARDRVGRASRGGAGDSL